MENLEKFAAAIVGQAAEQHTSIVTAESCSAGALAHLLSAAPGAGDVLHGGFVSYSKEFKIECLGVPADLIASRSAVCEEVALAMARCALKQSPRAGIGVAITGVLGPEPDEDGNPVGLLYVAAVSRDWFACERLSGKTERSEILHQALASALVLLERALNECRSCKDPVRS